MRVCSSCHSVAKKRQRLCPSCGTRSFVLVPLESEDAAGPAGQHDYTASLFAAGGVGLVAERLRLSKTDAARRVVTDGVLGTRIRMTPEAAAWLVSHPEASARQAAAKLHGAPMTAWRWRSRLRPGPPEEWDRGARGEGDAR
jgi:hypothetical protein